MRTPDRAPDEGAAAVEFALVSLLLLTILFGILQYGFFFFQAAGVGHGAREGARLASLGIPPTTAGCDAFASTVQARAGGADLTRVEATFTDTDGGPGITRGDTVAVRVVWAPQNFGFLVVPFLGPTTDTTATTRIERTNNVEPVTCVDTNP
jgi:Flp pilus assembly protein TadG